MCTSDAWAYRYDTPTRTIPPLDWAQTGSEPRGPAYPRSAVSISCRNARLRRKQSQLRACILRASSALTSASDPRPCLFERPWHSARGAQLPPRASCASVSGRSGGSRPTIPPSQHSTDHSDHHRSRASEASPARAATPTAREPRTLSHTRGHPAYALRRVIGGQHVESPAACEWLHGGSADGKGGNYRGGLQSQRSVRLGWQPALSVRTPGRPSFHCGKPRTLMQLDRIAGITQSGGPL